MWIEREEILMFSDSDISRLRRSSYTILQLNHHDVTLHSSPTGHDWIIISCYDSAACCIRHRHSQRDPYHNRKNEGDVVKSFLDGELYRINGSDEKAVELSHVQESENGDGKKYFTPPLKSRSRSGVVCLMSFSISMKKLRQRPLKTENL